jgi:hypothetical protein
MAILWRTLDLERPVTDRELDEQYERNMDYSSRFGAWSTRVDEKVWSTLWWRWMVQFDREQRVLYTKTMMDTRTYELYGRFLDWA